MGASALNINQVIADSQRSTGCPFSDNWPLIDILTSLRLTSGALPTAGSGNLRWLATQTDVLGLRWLTAGTTTDIAVFSAVVTQQYDWFDDQLTLGLCLRKNDATDENTDLAVTATMKFWSPGAANPDVAAASVPSGSNIRQGDNAVTTISAVSRTLAASGNTLDDYYWYWFNLGLGVARTGAANQLAAGDIVRIEIAPNEAVGSTDMNLDLAGAVLAGRANVAALNGSFRRFGHGWFTS
ncbi:MAG: hypothetical protein SFZ23_08650 [Planctomycetota bacterium]|nr:hypothetical protein [Planctomycetota bacterium]